MPPSSIHSLSEFLLHAGTDYRIFDLGRGIYPLTSQQFLEMENADMPVPRPRQQHAWFAILFWQAQNEQQHYIWFLKLPLDEQGKIISASRNHFLQIIVDALGGQITGNTSTQEKLPDNPYSFVPDQNQMAQFSALSRLSLALPMHQDTHKVKAYLQSPAVVDWRQIPMQAIADVAVRAGEAPWSELMAKQFFNLAEEAQIALLATMESTELPAKLQAMFLAYLQHNMEWQQPSPLHLAVLRALSTQHANTELKQFLENGLLTAKSLNIDTLVVLAARHYMQFDVLLIQQFLLLAAKTDAQQQHQGELFEGLFSDLVQLPHLRRSVLLLLRAPQQAPELQHAIETLQRKNKQSSS
jgi:GR25 family glycosyltransferase involved in LPS biosynthesis